MPLVLKNARPAAVPTQSTPLESSKRQFTFSEGNPSRAAKARQRPFDSALSPSGVANQMVPSELSRIEVTVLEASPFEIV